MTDKNFALPDILVTGSVNPGDVERDFTVITGAGTIDWWQIAAKAVDDNGDPVQLVSGILRVWVEPRGSDILLEADTSLNLVEGEYFRPLNGRFTKGKFKVENLDPIDAIIVISVVGLN